MKKINVFLVALVMTLPIFTSCKDMLEEEIYGKATVDEILTSEENIPLLVGQAYADVKWIHDHWGYWGVSSLTADECLCPTRKGNHWADGGYWRRLNNHTWDADADAFKNIWNTTISGAVLCNKLVDQLNTKKEEGVLSEEVTAQYVSELEVLRTFYFYMLYECFGRIPYTEKYAIDNENGGKEKYASDMPLMEVPAVWTMLVTSLEKNIQAKTLPVINSDAKRAMYYGRMTDGAANAMLAHLYINAKSYGVTPELLQSEKLSIYNKDKREYEEITCADRLASVNIKINSEADFYTNAIKCCDNVITNSNYSIEDNFFANFLINNENSKENIFVIVEEGNDKFDYRDYAGSMANKLRITMLTLHYQHKEVWNLIETPWNGFCARPNFLDLYKGKNEKWADVRGPGYEGNGTNNTKQWGWFIGPVYMPDGKKVAKDGNDSLVIIRQEVASLTEATWNDGARLLKYEVDKQAQNKYCDNDFVLYRYADILWLKEEAIKRGGTPGTRGSEIASADFQKMLTRAFAYEDEPLAAFKEAYGDPATWAVEDFLDERGREFAWENQRRRDLIRFEKYNSIQYSESSDPWRKWFPIPNTVIQKSSLDENGKPYWTQTTGY